MVDLLPPELTCDERVRLKETYFPMLEPHLAGLGPAGWGFVALLTYWIAGSSGAAPGLAGVLAVLATYALGFYASNRQRNSYWQAERDLRAQKAGFYSEADRFRALQDSVKRSGDHNA